MKATFLFQSLFFLILLGFLTQSFEKSLATPIERTPREHANHFSWGGGFLIGKPVKASEKGIIFDTFEMEIKVGSFEKSEDYIGTTVSVSTDLVEIFEEFKSLDTEKTYVFEYKYPSHWNYEIEESHYQIVAIHEQKLREDVDLEVFEVGLAVSSGRVGSYSQGVRVGRVTEVMRWGWVDIDCTIELNLSGLGGGGSATQENTVRFTIYGETGCRYMEDVLFYGKTVEIHYEEQLVELWEKQRRLIRKVVPKKSSSSSSPSEEQSEKQSDQLNDELFEAIRERLVNDPEFRESIKQILAE